MSRFIHPSRGLAALLLVSGLSITGAADDAPPTLAAAQALQLQHRPKEAIAQFTSIIDRNRYDVETSAPALIGLVACFQLLKGDAQAEKDYQRLTAKYLTKAPPLDGNASLDQDQAREDLLWKPWDQTPVFTVTHVQRERRLRNGKRESQLTLTVSTGKMKDLPIASSREDEMGRQMERDRRLAMRERDGLGQADLPDEGDKTHVAVGISPEGARYSGDISLDLWQRDSSSDELVFRLTFIDVPVSTTVFTSLSGSCPVSLIKRVTRQEIPLKDGATWKIGPGTVGTLVAIRDQGAEYGLQIAIAAADRKDDDEGGFSVSGSAFASASAGSGPGMDSDGPRFWLKGVSGKAMHAGGVSSTSTNGNSSLSCQFAKAEAAQCLVWETVAETSTHDVAFSLKDVAIP